jgi:hypothetical protein
MVEAFGVGVLEEGVVCFIIFLFAKASLVVAAWDGKNWILTCTE